MTDTIYEEGRLALPSGVSFEEWMKVGRTLSDMANSTPWWIGDWVNFGERYGETYSQGLTLWNCAYQTLANMAFVSRQFPPETRWAGLSWTHHRYAASLDPVERKALLERALQEEWTSRQLQIEVAKAKLNDLGDEEEVAVSVRYTVEISTNQREIRRTFSDINPFLMAVNEFAEKGLLDKPAVKVLEVGTCGTVTRS